MKSYFGSQLILGKGKNVTGSFPKQKTAKLTFHAIFTVYILPTQNGGKSI